MTSPAVGLTVVSGGINRLRTKAGSDKNSLFDLVNGYVTQANTVKVRPGSIRNADIGAISGGGVTKGLVGYQDELHIFAPTVVAVPTGYQLHVLQHPGGRDSTPNETFTNFTMTPGLFAGGVTLGTNDLAGVVAGLRGFGKAAVMSNATNVGSITGASWDGTHNLEAVVYTTPGSVDDPNYLYLAISGASASYAFNALGDDQLQYTDTNGNQQTLILNPAAQTAGSALELTTSYTVFGWNVAGKLPNFSGSTVGITRLFFEQSYDIIPLKEIHFAAPYLGGLYVVAEFINDGGSGLGTVFHYWIQSSTENDSSNNEWVADADHLIGDVVIPTSPNGLIYVASRRYPPSPLWTADTQETIGNVVEPNTPNGFNFTVSATAGATPTTGSTEPTWPAADGATVTEQSALANDQTVTIATAAPVTPAPTVQTRYSGLI